MNTLSLEKTCCVILGLFFLAAAPHKIFDPQVFEQSIAAYQLLPESLLYATARFLPSLELLLGTLLLCALWLDTALVLSTVLLCIFLAALLSAKIRGLDLDCGCFSPGDPKDPGFLIPLVRDIFLILLGVGGIWLRKLHRKHPYGLS